MTAAGCSSSPLPAVDFPTVPREVAQDARYGVVTSHEATVTLKAPGPNGKTPIVPLIRTTELWRVLVTGDMPESGYVREVPETDGCYVVKAEAPARQQGQRERPCQRFSGRRPSPRMIRSSCRRGGLGGRECSSWRYRDHRLVTRWISMSSRCARRASTPWRR